MGGQAHYQKWKSMMYRPNPWMQMHKYYDNKPMQMYNAYPMQMSNKNERQRKPTMMFSGSPGNPYKPYKGRYPNTMRLPLMMFAKGKGKGIWKGKGRAKGKGKGKGKGGGPVLATGMPTRVPTGPTVEPTMHRPTCLRPCLLPLPRLEFRPLPLQNLQPVVRLCPLQNLQPVPPLPLPRTHQQLIRMLDRSLDCRRIAFLWMIPVSTSVSISRLPMVQRWNPGLLRSFKPKSDGKVSSRPRHHGV